MTLQQTPAKVAANKILAGFNARADAAAGAASTVGAALPAGAEVTGPT